MQGRLRGALPVLSTLTLGVLSFVLLSTLEGSVQQALSSRSRDLLGADLALSSRRWLSDAEVSKARETFVASVGAGPSLRETEVLELFSMVSAPGQTRSLSNLYQCSQSIRSLGGSNSRHRARLNPHAFTAMTRWPFDGNSSPGSLACRLVRKTSSGAGASGRIPAEA